MSKTVAYDLWALHVAPVRSGCYDASSIALAHNRPVAVNPVLNVHSTAINGADFAART
jgi:hypothetical protein